MVAYRVFGNGWAVRRIQDALFITGAVALALPLILPFA